MFHHSIINGVGSEDLRLLADGFFYFTRQSWLAAMRLWSDRRQVRKHLRVFAVSVRNFPQILTLVAYDLI